MDNTRWKPDHILLLVLEKTNVYFCGNGMNETAHVLRMNTNEYYGNIYTENRNYTIRWFLSHAFIGPANILRAYRYKYTLSALHIRIKHSLP